MRTGQSCLSWCRSFRSTPFQSISLRSTIVSFSYLPLGLPCGLLWSLPATLLYATLLSRIHATCPTHFFILYFRVNAMYCTANMYENAFELYQIHMFFRQYLLTLFLDYLTTLFEVQKLPCRILCMRLCLCVTNKYGVGNVTVLAYGTASNYSGFTWRSGVNRWKKVRIGTNLPRFETGRLPVRYNPKLCLIHCTYLPVSLRLVDLD